MIRCAPLGTGSRGNSVLVDVDGTVLLLDAGMSYKTLKKKISMTGYDLKEVKYVLYTHEHGDHYNVRTEEKLNLPTIPLDELPVNVQSFDLEHDIPCIGYRVEDGCGNAMAYVTDTGSIPAKAWPMLRGLSILVIEANYDPVMLDAGSYSADLKERIMDTHLSNHQTANAVKAVESDLLRHVFLCHLSSNNNEPGKVMSAFFETGIRHSVMYISRQNEVSAPVTVM